ncbi:MAG: DUF4838 domain-containing protein [Chthoniobacterales bacterium]|nr:DUF4838 domain-containing protein [Chthoniobacterales bacterium]
MFRFLLATLFLTSSFAVAAPAFMPLPPDWRYLGAEAAPIQCAVSDLVYDGARAQVLKISTRPLQKGAKSQAGVYQHLAVDLARFPILTFKARFRGRSHPGLSLVLRGPKGLSLQKTFEPEGPPDKEGFYAFRWEIALRKDTGTVTENVQLLTDSTSFGKDETSEIEIIDFTFEGPEEKCHPAEIPPPRWIDNGPNETLVLPLQNWKPEDAEAGQSIEVESITSPDGPGLRLTYHPTKKFTPVTLLFPLNANDFSVFTFKAKVEVPPGAKVLGDVEAPLTGWYSSQFNAFADNFGVSLESKGGVPWTKLGVPRTHFLQHLDHGQVPTAGFRTFRWDMKHENPTGNKGFDLETVEKVQFFYDNRYLQPGEKVVITIISPQFVRGSVRTGGDPKRYAAFREAIKTLPHDTADSEKTLEAPREGRLPEPLAFIVESQPLGEIVGVASLWTPEGNAVNELYSWIYKLTNGVQTPVLKEPSMADNPKIFIGSAHAKMIFPEDLARLKGSDGCAIRHQGKNIYIFGATPKGTLNGVYTFLENNSDLIWPHPSEFLGAIYTSSANFSIRWADGIHRPPARLWGWMGAVSGPTLDYQIRNRCNYVGIRSDLSFRYWGLYMEEGGGHNLHSWIPFSLWKTHPEYWAFINGERRHPNGYKNQICLSNKEGRELFVGNILDRLERTPQMKAADCFNIKIEDNWGSCECDECLRPIRLPDGTLLHKDDIAFRSTEFFLFLNSVANSIHNRGFPEMKIGTYIYFFTVPVPRIPVTRFLRPYFADYVRKDYKEPIFAPINDIWWRTLNAWTAINDNVVMREYTGLYVSFRPLADVAAFDIRAELEAGVREFTSESLPTQATSVAYHAPGADQLDVSFPEYWIITRLYWDPDADVEQLRKYVLRRSFREASPAMEEFYGILRQLYYQENRTTDFEENEETLRLVVLKGEEDNLRFRLDEALRVVKHPLSRILVQQVKNYFETHIAQVKEDLAKGE